MDKIKKEKIRETQTFTVRAYQKSDRNQIRSLCCDTGYFGYPVDRVFLDRKWFADFNTNYYLRFEQDSCFVAEEPGGTSQIIGYILGCRHPLRFNLVFYHLIDIPLILKASIKSFIKIYDKKSRDYIKRLIGKGSRERPKRPKRTAHFHFNVAKGYRNKGVGKALIRVLFRHFLENQIHDVYGELLHAENLRDESFYTTHGFKFYDKKPTSIQEEKFGRIHWVTVTARIEETSDVFDP
jgi:GNAT superfamily N-acetyltransferase